MLQITGSVVKEQGVTFAVVAVKGYVLNFNNNANDLINCLKYYFPGIPIVLMAQDYNGTPTYYGRRDIVNFLANIPFEWIPWKKYTFN